MSKASVLLMLTFMNAARGDAPPLEIAPDLAAIADKRALSLCNKQLSHDGWRKYFEGTPYRVMGENLAKGFKSPWAAIDGLLHSPNHRANIMNPAFKRVGIGEQCGVVVQLFAN